MAGTFFFAVALLAHYVLARTVRSPTPPMGWNSYNTFACKPTEALIKQSARGLVDLGLRGVGYDFVTVDCGWMTSSRDSQGRLQWDTRAFPSGGKALGDFLHGLNLVFGLYSGAGYYHCGSTNLPASLGYERIDAQSFAAWGGDSLKYDNCYSTSRTQMVDYSSAEAQSPARFQRMAAELNAVNRDIQYYICQWGIGTNVGTWASAIGNTWRMSNDIYNSWRNIWRITNQVVPYYRITKPGAFADMDMLIIGLGALSAEEERFHFGMWAINKSPLIIGAALDPSRFSRSSLATLSNREVIAINQDSLSRQARLVRRYTVEEWDIWQGALSGSRQVIGLANWRNSSQTVTFSLASLGIASANARDLWAARDLGRISGSQTFTLRGHELKLLVLSGITTATAPRSDAYYTASRATISGSPRVTTCTSGTCLPAGNKVANINPDGRVAFSGVRTKASGKRLLGVDFINYDYAFQSAWQFGSNVRNMTIAVNGGAAKRWAFPISGGNWQESGRLIVEVDGFVQGAGNTVVFHGYGSDWAPDLVGFDVLE